MKKSLLLIAFTVILFACTNQQKAEKSIKDYLKKELAGGEYEPISFSKLFIIEPEQEDNIPSFDNIHITNYAYENGYLDHRRKYLDELSRYLTPDEINELDENISKTFWLSMNLYGIPAMLALSDCSLGLVKLIMANDGIFNKYQTGGKRYVMFHFFKAKEFSYIDSYNLGMCFSLDSVLNVTKVNKLKDAEEILKLLLLVMR